MRLAMSPPQWPLPATGIGGATAGTRLWRQRGQVYATVVVKATLALVPDAAMSLLSPDPLDTDERPSLAGQNLHTGGDMAPTLRQAELSVIGHAQGIPTPARRALDVRVGLARDGAFIYQKGLSLDAGGAYGSPVRLPLNALGPLSKHWPIRSRRLGGLDPVRLDGPYVDLPDTFDWEYFQTTPPDQRLPALRGDEWLVLEGIYLECPRLKTYLPRAAGVARLYGRDGALREGRPLRIGLDSLQIDVDRRCCSMLWRGYFPVSSQAVLASLHVVGGIERPGHLPAWFDPFAPRPGEPSPAAVAAAGGSAHAPAPDLDCPLDSTFLFSEADAQRLLQIAATPFQAKQRGAPSTPTIATPKPAAGDKVDGAQQVDAGPLGSTFQLSDADAQRLSQILATPFEAKQAVSPRPVRQIAAPEPEAAQANAPERQAMDPGPLGSTFQLSNADAQHLAELAATPFEGRKTALPLIAPATPLVAGPRKTIAGGSDEFGPRDTGPLGSTFQLSDADAQRLSQMAATPFEGNKSPEMPASLGEIFLAAMAEAATQGVDHGSPLGRRHMTY